MCEVLLPEYIRLVFERQSKVIMWYAVHHIHSASFYPH